MRVDSTITLDVDELSKREWKKLFKALTFHDAEGLENYYYRLLDDEGAVRIPRGAWNLLPDHVLYADQRVRPTTAAFAFERSLDAVEKDPRFEGQSEAVAAMIEQQQGIVVRPPGTGKTNIGIAFAAQAKTPILVLVHTKDILQQWVKEIETAIPTLKGKVGAIGSGAFSIGPITVGMVQTLVRIQREKPDEWEKIRLYFGGVLIDETHHAPASTWECLLNELPAFYRLGMTASATRADGLEKAIQYLIGPVIHKKEFSSSVPVSVRPVRTDFRYAMRGTWDWKNLLNALIRDEDRNQLIASKVDEEIAEGNSVLVLSRRIEHLERIADYISTPKKKVLTGKTKGREQALHDLRRGKLKVLLATQLADEAVDLPVVNRVALIYPGKHEGRLVQQVGRALRQHDGKENAVVLDFVDRKTGVLRRQWEQRRRFYRQSKIKIEGGFSIGKK